MGVPSRSGEAVAVVGGSGLLVGSWLVVAASGDIPGAEAGAFRAVNGLPDRLWPFLWAPMQAGSFGGSVALSAVTLAVTRRPRLAGAALAASQAAFWTAKVVKRSAGRGRPHVFLPDVRRREDASGLGYVSGHAGVAFALAAAVAPSAPPRWRPVVFGGAALVGMARQFAGVHLPLDVVGGAGLGLLTGTLARWSFRLGGYGVAVSG